MLKKIFIILFLIVSGKVNSQSYYEFSADDLNGNIVNLSEVAEKGPFMIGFWRSWCPSCKEEQRNMQIIFEKYKDKGFTYLGINIDNQKSVSKVKSFVEAYGFTFPVILDTDKKIFEAYGGSEDAVPYYLIFGKNKTMLSKHLGYKTGDEIMIESEIKAALDVK